MASFLQRIGSVVSTAKARLVDLFDYKNSFSTTLLLGATKRNWSWCTSALIFFGADVNATDQHSNTALHYATLNKNQKVMRILMLNGAKESVDHFSSTLKTSPWVIALKELSLSDSDAALRMLAILLNISDKSKTDAEFKKEVATKTLLREAEYRGQFKFIDKLIAYGADVSASNKDGNNLFHFAAKNNSSIAMKRMMKAAAREEKIGFLRRNKHGELPIHWAAKFHAKGTLQVLAEAGSPIDSQDFLGNSLLHAALSTKDSLGVVDEETLIETLTILLNIKVDETVLNNKQHSLLHLAVILNNHTALQYFIARNTLDINGRDFNDRTPLHLAIYFNSNPEILETLITSKTDLLAQDKYGNIPLHYLRINPEHSRSPTVVDDELLTYYRQVIKALTANDFSAQLFKENKLGQTPLQYIIAENIPISMLQMLLESIPKDQLTQLLNTKDIHGNTILHTACEYCSAHLYKDKYSKHHPRIQQLQQNALEVVMLLINKGADPKIKNNIGETALQIAIEANNEEIVKYLHAQPKTHSSFDTKRDINKPLITAQYVEASEEKHKGSAKSKNKNGPSSIFPK